MRRLKTLSVVLVVALTGSAALGSIARAEKDFHFKADGHYVTFTAAESGVFTGEAGQIECNFITYIGEEVESATTFGSFELAMTSADCEAVFGTTVHVDTNGCNYVLNAGTKTELGSPPTVYYEGSAGINCPPEQEITMTVTAFETVVCTVHLPEQGPLGTVTYRNGEGNTSFFAEIELSGIEYSQTAGTGFGACETGAETTDGTYVAETHITGDNNKEQPTSLWVE